MQTQIIDIKRIQLANPAEPVTLDQVKQHLRVDFTDDDTYITSLMTQCRRGIENYCQISIVPYTVTLTVNYQSNEVVYPRGPGYGVKPYNPDLNGPSFELPFGPLPGSVTSVTAIGNDNSSNALDPTAFDYIIWGANYKTIGISNTQFGNAVIVYNTGYDPTDNPVPDDLILAILNEIAFRFEARGDSTNRYAAQNVGISEAAQYLANPYKRLAWL